MLLIHSQFPLKVVAVTDSEEVFKTGISMVENMEETVERSKQFSEI